MIEEFISCLLLTSVACLGFVVLVYIQARSRLARLPHILLFLFFLNYLLAFSARLLNLLAEFIPGFEGSGLLQPSWYAFGPLALLYCYFTILPANHLKKSRHWLLLFLPAGVEIFVNFLVVITDSGVFMPDFHGWVTQADQWIDSGSFIYFSIHVFLLIILIYYKQVVTKYRILYSLDTTWLWGLSLFLIVFVVVELTLPTIYLYVTSTLFLIFVLLFLFFQPQVISLDRNSFKEHLREVFSEINKPALLLDQHMVILYANNRFESLMGTSKRSITGEPLSKFMDSPSDDLRHIKENNKNKIVFRPPNNELFNAICFSEVLQMDSENRLISLYFVEVERLGFSLTHEEKNQIDSLQGLFDTEKIYLNPFLQQAEVAEKLGISKRKVGRMIRDYFQCSFSEYVNRHRVSHAEGLLIHSVDLNIEEVIKASGFNSKSSFFTEFRKYSGLTPGQLKKDKDQ